jgi:DNA topoisomerase-3
MLKNRDGATSGQLHKELGGGAARGEFEALLDGLARQGLVEMRPDSFVKGSRTIRFHRVFLTRSGRLARPGFEDAVEIVDLPTRRTTKKSPTSRRSSPSKRGSSGVSVTMDPADIRLFDELREWRLAEARRRRVPAFRILTDRVLVDICRARPADVDELLDVPGIGPAIARKYGKAILATVSKARPRTGEG